jgi:hypothetical protein
MQREEVMKSPGGLRPDFITPTEGVRQEASRFLRHCRLFAALIV